jgi:hypothetical protein
MFSKDHTLMSRITRMTTVQTIITTHHYIIANIIDLVIVVFSRFDIDILEREVPAWLGF